MSDYPYFYCYDYFLPLIVLVFWSSRIQCFMMICFFFLTGSHCWLLECIVVTGSLTSSISFGFVSNPSRHITCPRYWSSFLPEYTFVWLCSSCSSGNKLNCFYYYLYRFPQIFRFPLFLLGSFLFSISSVPDSGWLLGRSFMFRHVGGITSISKWHSQWPRV